MLIDMEVALAKALGWSLYDIDRTDIDSMFGFIGRLVVDKLDVAEKTVFADEASWL